MRPVMAFHDVPWHRLPRYTPVMWKLVLVFTLLPVLEMVIFYQLGTRVGIIPTAILILVTGVFGAWLARREGISVLTQVTEGMRQGIPPAQTLVEGALIVGGGLLLITPGTLTDIMGFSAILPPTRRLLAPIVLNTITSRISLRVGSNSPPHAPNRPPPPEPHDGPPKRSPFDHPIH